MSGYLYSQRNGGFSPSGVSVDPDAQSGGASVRVSGAAQGDVGLNCEVDRDTPNARDICMKHVTGGSGNHRAERARQDDVARP